MYKLRRPQLPGCHRPRERSRARSTEAPVRCARSRRCAAHLRQPGRAVNNFLYYPTFMVKRSRLDNASHWNSRTSMTANCAEGKLPALKQSNRPYSPYNGYRRSWRKLCVIRGGMHLET